MLLKKSDFLNSIDPKRSFAGQESCTAKTEALPECNCYNRRTQTEGARAGLAQNCHGS
jgi:hypothetical protein